MGHFRGMNAAPTSGATCLCAVHMYRGTAGLAAGLQPAGRQWKEHGSVSKSDAPPLRLIIELVPETCWYSNLRDVLPRDVWDRLRREVYRSSGYRCGICGARGQLHCHEVWRYDDAAHIQHLEGFRALCPRCHHVKHIGLAAKLASEGRLDYEAVVAHFMRVNGCTRDVFQRHYRAAMAQWRERSRYEWQTDLGDYTPPAPSESAP
jgi:hypothetical protein